MYLYKPKKLGIPLNAIFVQHDLKSILAYQCSANQTTPIPNYLQPSLCHKLVQSKSHMYELLVEQRHFKVATQ